MSESAPAAPVEAPIRRAPSQAEMLRLANKEIETRQSISPAVAHVLTGSESERGRFHPDSNGELTQPEKDRLSGLSADGLAYKLADEVSLRSREETKTDWNEWHSDLEAWTKNKFGQRFTEEDVTRLEVLQSVHLMSDTGDAQNKYLATVEEFRNQYFWDKDTGRPKSDIKQFVMDVAEGCKDENGNVDMKKLEARLNSVQELLVAFGEKTSADLMVRDFALSYGVLKQSAEMRQQVVDEAAKKIQEPVGDQEQDYLKALADQALTVRTTAVPPTPPATQPATPPPGTPESPTVQERASPQPATKNEMRVEGREGQPGMTIRMGGETLGKDPTKENQDAMWFDARHMAGIICDGMGGHPDGDKAAKVVRDSLKASLERIPNDLQTAEAATNWLRQEIMKANQEVLQGINNPAAITQRLMDLGIDYATATPEQKRKMTAGTTATVVFVWTGPNGEKELITGNVGDSRISVIRNNKLRDLTYDQSGFRLNPDGSHRSWEEIRELQEMFANVSDPDTLTGEDRIFWQTRHRLLAAVDGTLVPQQVEVRSHTLTYGDKIRILGRSDGLLDVTTNAHTKAVSADFADPQQAAHELIEKAKRDDTGPRQKSTGPDDKSIFVMDIIIDQPQTSEIEAGSATPITYDDERLVKILLNKEIDLYQQLVESIPRSERQAWDPQEQERAKKGMRQLYEAIYEGFQELLPGATYEDAMNSFLRKDHPDVRQRARAQGRKVSYQIGSFSKSHFLHFGENYDPPPGTTDAFPSAHRVYVLPKPYAVGEVTAEVIRKARAAGYEPYGKVWDEALEDDPAEITRRKDRILFLPRTQAQQDIILTALRDIQRVNPDLFEDNPLLLSEKVSGLKGVGTAEEPVQTGDSMEKKSFNTSREELLGAAREYILSTRVGPSPDRWADDIRTRVLQTRLDDGTLQMNDLLNLVQRVIRGLAPKFNVDPDNFSHNLQHS